ncbi:MAG: hypothetical protein MJ211_15210 [Bacteroidales bacterium]|nr:hypothetical protein [Bacteroidales bacterium]
MPRGYNCGFIYEGGSLHTVAHELGHGIGNLEHAFVNSNSSGKTKNLMDYSYGTELYHFQWNEIQDPSRVWMKWSKEESEGEMLDFSEKNTANFNKNVASLLNELCKCPSFKFVFEILLGDEKKIVNVKQVSHNDKLYKVDFKTTCGFWDANTFTLCLFYDEGSNYNYNISTIIEEFYHAAHYIYLKNKGTDNLAKIFLTQTEIEVELFKYFIMYFINKHKSDFSLVVNRDEFDSFSISNDNQLIETFEYMHNMRPWEKNWVIMGINNPQKSDNKIKDFYNKTEFLMYKTPFISQIKSYGSYESMNFEKFDTSMPFFFNCVLR